MPHRIGTWNLRGLGGRFRRSDPALKIECVLKVLESRRWKACLLSDLCYPTNGVREYFSNGRKWVIVNKGKVGVALNEEFAAQWRESGAIQFSIGGAERKTDRTLALYIAGKGWRKGWYLVAAYAPTSAHTQTKERQRFYDDLEK